MLFVKEQHLAIVGEGVLKAYMVGKGNESLMLKENIRLYIWLLSSFMWKRR